MLLIVVSVCTATGAWNWLIDPETQKVSFFTSLWNHPFFTISCITLIGLFFAGIHKRVVAPSIIAARCRTVLAEYNMSCDDTGKLILKPRPHVQWQSALLLENLNQSFLKWVIQQNAIEDSFWSRTCDGLAATDKKCAILAQMMLMMLAELAAPQYLWLPVFSISVTSALQPLHRTLRMKYVGITKLNLETKPPSVFIMYFCKLL